MALDVDRPSGPDFRQDQVPIDLTLGNVWYRPAQGQLSISNGSQYGGWIEDSGIAGYIGGMYTTGGPTNTVHRLYFFTESVTTLASVLTPSNYTATGVAYLVNGYILGGAPVSTLIERLVFADESVSTISTAMLRAAYAGIGGINSATVGYDPLGYVGGQSTLVDKLTFATEAMASVTSGLSVARYYFRTCDDAATKGYASGGWTGAATSTRTDRLTFSNENIASIASSLTTARYVPLGGVSSSVNGYIGGGNPTGGYAGNVTTIDRIVFATEIDSQITSGFGAALSGGGSPQSKKSGYFCGGITTASGYVSSIYRLTFTTESTSLMGSTLMYIGCVAGDFEH